ncbi:MAG: hypothetical protein ACKO3T_07835 [Planctomycetaceae bacterium]
MSKQCFVRSQILAACLLAAFCDVASSKGDIIILDDFSTPLQFNDGQFSRSDSRNDVWLPEVVIAPDVTASWYDEGAGILGGRRNVVAQNAANSNQSSTICIDNGFLSVDSPSSNFICLACLSYKFTGIDVAFHHVFLINISSMDTPAVGNIGGVLKIKDNVGTMAIGTIPAASLKVGTNRFELSGMSNWSSLNKTNVTFAELSFTTASSAADFVVGRIAFSTNPEPTTFTVMLAGFACFACTGLRKRWLHNRRKVTAA